MCMHLCACMHFSTHQKSSAVTAHWMWIHSEVNPEHEACNCSPLLFQSQLTVRPGSLQNALYSPSIDQVIAQNATVVIYYTTLVLLQSWCLAWRRRYTGTFPPVVHASQLSQMSGASGTSVNPPLPWRFPDRDSCIAAPAEGLADTRAGESLHLLPSDGMLLCTVRGSCRWSSTQGHAAGRKGETQR